MGSVEKNKNVKSRKPGHKMPKHVNEMSKEVLQATLKKKRECNAKALEIVENLLENTFTEEWLLDNLRYISECHYQDVIEERVISMTCGYPLCSKKLKNIPSQQYHISTKLNKVYDITERKNFCSNQCYRASSYLKNQLLTSPLWIRDKEEIPTFKLLPVESLSGGVGDEVDIGQNNSLKEEMKELHTEEKNNNFTSVADFTIDSLSKLAAHIDKEEKKERKLRRGNSRDKEKHSETNPQEESKLNSNNTNCTGPDHKEESISENKESNSVRKSETHTIMEVSQQYIQKIGDNVNAKLSVEGKQENKAECETKSNKSLKSDKAESIIDSVNAMKLDEGRKGDTVENRTSSLSQDKEKEENKTQLKPKKNRESKKKKEPKKNTPEVLMTSAVIHIEKCLYEWFTVESLCFLLGEDKVKEMVSEKGECIKEYYKVVHNASWDPKMHEQYMTICRRLNIMEIEDRKFDNEHLAATKPLPDYTAVKEESRKMDLKVQAFFQGKTAYEDSKVDSVPKTTNDIPPVLPLVDLHAQNAHRRRIVLDRLNRILPDLLRTFGLTSRDIGGDVRNLVSTFSLGAHNITFKPPEWSLLGLIIIKMLSIKDTRLRILLDSEQVTKYITLMLISFQQDGGYLDRLMAWLTDIDNLLHKQQ